MTKTSLILVIIWFLWATTEDLTKNWDTFVFLFYVLFFYFRILIRSKFHNLRKMSSFISKATLKAFYHVTLFAHKAVLATEEVSALQEKIMSSVELNVPKK